MSGESGTVVAYLVAERRGGRWLLGDDWAQRCDTLTEAQEVIGRAGSGYDVGILAVIEVAATGEPTA